MTKARAIRMLLAFLLGVIVPCAGTFWFLSSKAPDQAPSVGVQAPSFEVVGVSGDTVRSSGYEGRRLLLLFVDVGCPACLEELGSIDMLAGDEACDGLNILAVSESGPERTAGFADDFAMHCPLAMDSGAMRTEYGVGEVPDLILIDETGRIRFRRSGRMGRERLRRLVSEFGSEGRIPVEALVAPGSGEESAPTGK